MSGHPDSIDVVDIAPDGTIHVASARPSVHPTGMFFFENTPDEVLLRTCTVGDDAAVDILSSTFPAIERRRFGAIFLTLVWNMCLRIPPWQRFLVTCGLGFIIGHVVEVISHEWPDALIVLLDKLTSPSCPRPRCAFARWRMSRWSSGA